MQQNSSFFLRTTLILLSFFFLFSLKALGEEKCDWLLNHKGKKYKIFSLYQNASLDTPLSSAQQILATVPEAKKSMANIERNNQKIRLHTIASTVGVLALLGSHLVREIGDNNYTRTNATIDITSAVLILQGIFFSKQLKKENERQMRLAVESFNAKNKETISITKGGR